MDAPPTPTHLYLIRHAEAISNVEPVIGGMEGDRGLSPRGVAQSQRLRDRLIRSGELRADVLLSSTLPRARQTAEILAPALGLPIGWEDDLHELRPGDADGLSHEQFLETFGRPDFWAEPFRPISPHAEIWGEFMLRVARTLERITREHKGSRIVIICHGGVVEGSFVYFMNLPCFRPPPVAFDTQNTSITHWDQYLQQGQPPRWRLRRYNDAVHLVGMEADGGGPARSAP